ncbi:MAG: PASTA domain-containing protein [Bacilli bacterium]|nr:PASTA domain-containing protein [Bacilli bacterium]
MGLKLGKETLFKYIDNFGFGHKTGVELNGEENGIIFDINKIGDLELATTAFGQGVSVTPIQQITAVSAAINGGILYQPHIVKSINEPELNNVILDTEIKKIRQVISPETSKQVRYVLESVVAKGTGHNAYIPNYRVGGKTGTAQKVNNGAYMTGNYITSFIGFMPADDPKIVVYIAVDNAKGVTQYGGTIAAPIAKNVLLDSINILNIEPRDNEIEKEYVYLDKVYSDIPNVIGMNYDEAKNSLKNFKVLKIGEGTVKYQSPKAGIKIETGTEVRLFLSS